MYNIENIFGIQQIELEFRENSIFVSPVSKMIYMYNKRQNYMCVIREERCFRMSNKQSIPRVNLQWNGLLHNKIKFLSQSLVFFLL